MKPVSSLILYQLSPRSFTEEGTLSAAATRLGEVAALGVDVIYLSPVFCADNDPDLTTWSPRQKASGTNNPKNPYKMADYFHVDEEYGTDEDLRSFVREAHRLGLQVLFDLVYLHCGRNAVFVREHPEYVICDASGKPIVGEDWPFARLNFESKGLRTYLLGNMETLLREFDADGFRCDVGSKVPLDFWRDSFAYLKAIKPDLITLNEGRTPEYVDGVFDMAYDTRWRRTVVDILANGGSAKNLREWHEELAVSHGSNAKKLIRYLDNHDTASDCGLDRNEIIMTSRGVEAGLVLCNTIEGIPFLWNGYEFCDDAENNMFSNRFYGKRSAISRDNSSSAKGIRRMAVLKELHRLRHGHEALTDGLLIWLENSAPDDVISYVRKTEKETVLVVVNCRNSTVSVQPSQRVAPTELLLQADTELCGDTICLHPYGYLVAKLS